MQNMMRPNLFHILMKGVPYLTVMLLAACNLPLAPKATPSSDMVATQVSQLLTKVPVDKPTQTAILPTPQVLPTSTPAVTLAPPPTPTLKNTITVPQQPSATPLSGDPKNVLGKPTWQDTLDSGKSFYLYDNGNT